MARDGTCRLIQVVCVLIVRHRYRTRKCATKQLLAPRIMHDKSPTFLAGVRAADLLSFLCDWHGIEAFGRKLLDLKSLAVFGGPITLAFKAVLCSVDDAELTHRYDGLRKFLDGLPQELVSQAEVTELKSYLEEHWFGKDCEWRAAATKARLLMAPSDVWFSPSANTNNQTERMFLALMQEILRTQIAKSPARFMMAVHDHALQLGATLVYLHSYACCVTHGVCRPRTASLAASPSTSASRARTGEPSRRALRNWMPGSWCLTQRGSSQAGFRSATQLPLPRRR